MIFLETKRLVLRDYVETDFDDYYRLKSDAKTMYYLQDILFIRSFGERVIQLKLLSGC